MAPRLYSSPAPARSPSAFLERERGALGRQRERGGVAARVVPALPRLVPNFVERRVVVAGVVVEEDQSLRIRARCEDDRVGHAAVAHPTKLGYSSSRYWAS